MNDTCDRVKRVRVNLEVPGRKKNQRLQQLMIHVGDVEIRKTALFLYFTVELVSPRIISRMGKKCKTKPA